MTNQDRIKANRHALIRNSLDAHGMDTTSVLAAQISTGVVLRVKAAEVESEAGVYRKPAELLAAIKLVLGAL